MKRLRLAIDGNEANVPNRVGSNVYAFEILSAIEKSTRRRKDWQITVLLANQPQAHLPHERDRWHYKIIKPTPFWTQLALPLHLFNHKHDYDVLYTPGHYAPRFSAVKYVSTVMDLAYLRFPEQFKKRDLVQLKEWTAYSVKHARKIITISRYSKQDIVWAYDRKPSEIVVAYPAVQDLVPVAPTIVRKTLRSFQITDPYILYVGTIQPRKNIGRVVDAFEKMVMEFSTQKGNRYKPFKNLQLVIAGKTGWLAAPIIRRINESPLKDRIIMTGYISELEKKALYQGATASVLVGLYEGFGIPALESLQLGTVPVVAQTTSLPEVVGDAGILVDPTKTDSISNGLKKAVLMTATERGLYRRKGRSQLRKFSWIESAAKILTTLEEVATET